MSKFHEMFCFSSLTSLSFLFRLFSCLGELGMCFWCELKLNDR